MRTPDAFRECCDVELGLLADARVDAERDAQVAESEHREAPSWLAGLFDLPELRRGDLNGQRLS